MRRVAILGSTGSIGRQALEVAGAFPDRVRIVGLAAGGGDVETFLQQVRTWSPDIAALRDSSAAGRAAAALAPATGSGAGRSPSVLGGPEGVREVATWPGADLVLNAVVGFEGLGVTLAAFAAGKDVALASKEPIVAAGGLITRAAAASGGLLLPVDSEPSAIFQLLAGRDAREVARVVLTASGGPFYGASPAELDRVTPEAALRHPTWRMGPKITVDSATLMNKGFEVLEASWLFGIPVDRIDVLIHRSSLVHSLIVLEDGVLLAHLGPPDMRYPIQHALTFPERLSSPWPRLDLGTAPPLAFSRPDSRDYPCLNLAYEVGRIGKSLPAVLSGADEVAVAGFLGGRIGFADIPRLLEHAMSVHDPFEIATPEDAARADLAGRQAALDYVSSKVRR